MSMQDYSNYMREAIALAHKSRLDTWPNPAVGAVLVKDGQIVARGRHKAARMPHAEIECLADARARHVDPRGSTMVVTLEPCAHYGKTPPCTDALLAAGIGSLVYGTSDPNPQARGGAARLAEAGVEVIGPVLQGECEDLIADFKIWQNTRRPYVILKLASTLDGRIATRTGNSRWISDTEARREVHELREKIGKAGGGVLVGGATFRADNPELTARLDNKKIAQPFACIFTSRLPRADADYSLLKNRPHETVFFTSPAASASTNAEALRKLGCRIFPLPLSQNFSSSDLASMFEELRQDLGAPYILCEGGGKLALSLLEAGLVDEFHLYMAPMVLGDNEARPLFTGRSPINIGDALNMRISEMGKAGNDIHLLLRPPRSKVEA